MKKPGSNEPRRERDPSRAFVTLCAAAIAVAVSLDVFVQRPTFSRLLSPETGGLVFEERLLFGWSPWAETLLFFLPSVALGVAVVALVGRRPGYAVFVATVASIAAFVALDVESYATFGRHLSELLRLAATGGGTRVVGDPRPWAWIAARWLALSVAGVAVLTTMMDAGVRRLWASCSRSFRSALVVFSASTLAVAALVPGLATASWRNRALLERLYGALPFDVRFQSRSTPPPLFDAPEWKRLEASMRSAYARAFPLLYAKRATPDVGTAHADRRPDIVLFVAESLRADVFSPEYFPRLSVWAKGGLVAREHYGGSNSSEAGLFSIFYGRAPLEYHAALDAKEPPALCSVAHRLGYECAYFSGQPEAWDRVEEFVNPRTLDVYVHDDSGDWPNWDRHAVENLLAHLSRPDRKPVIAVVYLMASHFPYEYPPAEERHRPVVPFDRGTRFLDVSRSDYGAYENRYANSLAFTDDLLADAFERIDSAKTVLAFTGDHGESLGEDGRLGHGYGFSDAVARVPFAMVGPGVAQATVSTPTLHVDLLPTWVELTTGAPPSATAFQGRSLSSRAPPRTALLLSRCSLSRDHADALLLDGSRRILLSLGLRGPELEFKGLEVASGAAVALGRFTSSDASELANAFETELDAARR